MLKMSFSRALTAVAATALLATAAAARPEVRDPFVNQNSPLATPRTSNVVRAVEGRAQPAPVVRALPAAEPVAVKNVVVVAPDVQVSGIVSSHGARQAILTDGQRSYLVRVGQQLADYRVKAIEAGSVTLDYQGHSFKIPMAKGV